MSQSKRLIAIVLVLLTAGANQALAQVTVDTSNLELGREYERLTPTQPTSSSPDTVEVAEVFWYGCPHCYNFESFIEKWLLDKADYISFVRIPAVWNDRLRMHARAFYTEEVLGKTQEMHRALFDEIHVRHNMLDTEEALAEFFGRFGVDETEFKSAFDSFEVHTKLERAEELGRRYRITGVPTIIVNGKYKTSATMTGSYDNLLAVVDALAAREHAGQ
jgi:thiol:disulfide interchange protein DsbA